MNFLRSRSEQLADYLRGRIAREEVSEPLPGTRAWAEQLGVSRRTIDGALRILRREGLITVDANRGMRLVAAPRIPRRPDSGSARVVRVIHYGREFPDEGHWLPGLADRLHVHGVQVSFEKWMAARLQAYARARPNPNELLILVSLPAKFQALFNRTHGVLLLGEPAPGIRCPFISHDIKGAFRHATLRLLRRGFERVTLLLPRARAPGLELVKRAVESACTEWAGISGVRNDVVQFPMEWTAMVAAAGRFARTVRDRRGILVEKNIPVGLVMTALAAHGVPIPKQVELVTFVTSSHSLKVFPVPAYYVYSEQALVQAVTNAALRYFETGAVPSLAKRLPLEIGQVE